MVKVVRPLWEFFFEGYLMDHETDGLIFLEAMQMDIGLSTDMGWTLGVFRELAQRHVGCCGGFPCSVCVSPRVSQQSPGSMVRDQAQCHEINSFSNIYSVHIEVKRCIWKI